MSLPVPYLHAPRRRRIALALLALAAFYSSERPLVAAVSATNHQLFAIRPDGSEIKQITRDLASRFGSACLSPDGKQIAADCAPAQLGVQETRIVVMDADGGNIRDLGPGAMPCWSPDGKLLTFHVYDNNGAIIVAQANGEGREEVAAHWGSPRWSADPRLILSIFQYRAFALLDLKTGKEQVIPLVGGSSPYEGFDISADQKRICYSDRTRGGLVVADLDDKYRLGNPQRFVGDSRCEHCSWSPDAKRVVFTNPSGAGGRPQLFILDVDSGDPPVEMAGQNADAANVNPHWSPDGEWILFSSDLPE